MLKKLIGYSAVLFLALLATDIAINFVYPGVSNLKKENPRKTAFMEYREKEWAREGIKKSIIQKWVPLKRISPYLIKAVIIAEDDKFWGHEGFDFEAMQQALEKDIKKKQFKAGGSTISQQLAKNLYLSPSKNPIRKIKEAILTWRMERTLSKRRIVEIYLNVAEWGDGIFGIEAAAKHYYGKHASSLTAQEAARLATVLPNPLVYHVNGDSKYVQNRSARIYQVMIARGIVIPEYDEVMTAPEEATPEETALVVTTGTLTRETSTAGIKPPSGEATQDKTPEESTQKIETPNLPNATTPEAGSDNSPAPEPASGAGNGETK
jgi:monofunctional biosynthetic peptidoglycan transglycosylase